jgi:hypothetical protein
VFFTQSNLESKHYSLYQMLKHLNILNKLSLPNFIN